MAKTLDEIYRITEGRQVGDLKELTCMELDILLSAMNRLRVSLPNEEDFARFYLEVFSLIQNCYKQKSLEKQDI